MDVKRPVAELSAQVDALWRTQTVPFLSLIEEYTACLQQAQEAQVRARQLDKEAGELRAENDTLLKTLEDTRRSTVSHAENAAVQSRLSQAETDLTAAYKDKSMLAEAGLQATQQLAVVRDINEQQGRELREAEDTTRSLRDQLRSMRATVERLEESLAMSGREAETRREEAAEASGRAASLEADNVTLARRLVELKEAEIDRMNDINRQRDEMLTSAKRQAAELLAKALAQARATGQTGSLVTTTSGLGLTDVGLALPATLLHSVAGTHEAGCYGLAFNRAGTLLASCGADKTVKLWDVMSGATAPTATLHGAFEGVNSVAWTQDGRLVVGAESRAALRVWAAESGRLTASLTGHSGRVTGVAASPTDASVLVSCGADRTIKMWGLDRGFCTRTLMCHSTCNAVAWAGAGSLVASAHFDGTLRLWDAGTGRQVSEVAGLHGGQISCVDVGASGATVLTAGKDNVVRVVDLRALRVLSTLTSRYFSVGGTGSVVAFSGDEKHAAAGSADGSVVVWDLAKPAAPVSRLASRQAASPISALAWDPLGSPLVTGSKAGSLGFWVPPDEA